MLFVSTRGRTRHADSLGVSSPVTLDFSSYTHLQGSMSVCKKIP